MPQHPSSVSRRTFLESSAAAIAALATTPLIADVNSSEPKKLGFALVGVGTLTMDQLLPALAKCKLARAVALVSGHPDKARQQAALYNIDPKNIYTYDNFDSIKDNPDIDVVYIVLPNSMHAEYTIRAAHAGKHVLCEKPMANTVEECQSMIDACVKADRKLMIGYRQRYEPLTIRAIELSHSQSDIGTIKQITAEAGFNTGDPTQWRLNKKLAGGGPLMDMGIYAVNAIRYLSSQEPSEVTAFSYTTPNDPRFKEVEETIAFELRFDSGLLASVLTSYGFGCNRFRLYGTHGQLESEPLQSYTNNRLWLTHNGPKQEITYTHVNHFAAEMDHLADCILNNKPVLTPGEEGLKDMKVITAAYESARLGKSVKII
ncbi:MAG TPA: Gfo/Idh/MocA family oxidoreductase [Tepidisphaeraceae bacterium]|nr:Gfo/Idh/MocA family oxidoreductase [Tepidisphaeraceae bacterium]